MKKTSVFISLHYFFFTFDRSETRIADIALIINSCPNFNTAKYYNGIFPKTIHNYHKTMYFETFDSKKLCWNSFTKVYF